MTRRPRRKGADRVAIGLAILVQTLCAGVFLSDILSSRIGWRREPISWQARELIEIGAALGLILGIVLGAVALTRVRKRTLVAEEKLRDASRAFLEMVEIRFDGWGLTPAERDVALFSVKGMTLAEIAAIRGTSEGTVKAQCNALYRKAGVSGRAQLLSDLIDGLVDENVMAGLVQTRPTAGDPDVAQAREA